MKKLRMLVGLAFLVAALMEGNAQGMDISGTLSSTLTIYENSRLVGDVTCTMTDAPCIALGASHIQLRLNGFTITGPANPPTGCVVPDPTLVEFLPGDGVWVQAGLDHVAILGPGLVQRFARHGIHIGDFGPGFSAPPAGTTTKVRVKGVTSSHNCFSGLQLSFVSDSDIEENVSMRNAIASGSFPCGGNCVFQSPNNRIRRNVFGGNGLAVPNNDFGVGLTGLGSTGNVVEENAIVGNTNGVRISPGLGGNLVRRNIITGNPPVQLNVTFGAFGGVDILNLGPAGANAFEENLCLTYSGPGPAPCPNIPKFAGHHNTSQASSEAP
ncbi:MAG: right-handed parallel beta-helix repeat-containing protein [Acidobacteria bacterium]|nr:right-handed parallel beta-helix repeat-containing protein [Acidobacteriota bacterium]